MIRVEAIHRPPSHWQAVAVFALATGFAIGATALLASYADSAGWCCVHTWALAHSTGLIVLLSFGLLGFHVVRAVGTRLGLLTPSARSSWSALPHVAYISGALGSFYYTQHFMWLGLAAGLAAVWMWGNGRAVQPFGLAIVGLLVSVLCAASWLYISYIVYLR
jgi:hypothetical protein